MTDYREVAREWLGHRFIDGASDEWLISKLATLLEHETAKTRQEQHRASYQQGWQDREHDPRCKRPVAIPPPKGDDHE